MKRLFRWYVGDHDTPFWFYPKGLSWARPKRWWYAKCLTRFSTYMWREKGGKEELLSGFVCGTGFKVVPWVQIVKEIDKRWQSERD